MASSNDPDFLLVAYSEETLFSDQPLDSDSSATPKPPAENGEIILNLARVMADRKISLGDLAAQVGISNVNLSKIKNNHVTAIRFSTLAALCSALDCQVSDLLEYHQTKS